MPQPKPDYLAHFRRYALAYQNSLGDHVEVQTIRGFFAESFIGLPVTGGVQAGANDDDFGKVLEEAYGFYRAIGTQTMAVDKVEVTELAQNHDSVRVFYRASYRNKQTREITIPFDVVYLLQRREDGPKIFGFIAGDEMALYKQHGLVNDKGEPL